jgi:transposase
LNEKKCLNCGNPLSKKQIWQKRKYCSRKCFLNHYWGEQVKLGNTVTRSKKLLEVAEACRNGLTQIEVSKAFDISLLTIHNWFARCGANNIAADKKCAICGNPMTDLKNISSRKYCSKQCESKAKYLRKYPIPQRVRYDSEFREKALELYWGGAEGALIAKHLNVSKDTVYGWIHDFGHTRERTFNPELIKLLPANLRIANAKTPMVWQSILSENAPDGDKEIVVIVCGFYNSQSGINKFTTVLSDKLKADPCDGRIYAFCSQSRDQISTICFKNGAFILTKRPKIKGCYIWPDESLGNEIQVQNNEFEYLLSLSKSRRKMCYLLDKSQKI